MTDTRMRLAHLHAHTTFSFLDGYGTPRQIVDRLQELGHTSCAITDHGNVVGHVPVGQEMVKAGINPVYGCEFYVCDDMKVRGPHSPSLGPPPTPKSPGPLPHITVLARTQEGYENLLRLSSLSYSEGTYYKPRVDVGTIARYSKGLVVLSGCPGGYPSRLIAQGRLDDAERLLGQMRDACETFYVEVTPQPDYDVARLAMPYLYWMASRLNIPVVMTADCHFPRPEHHAAQDVLLAVGLRKTVNDPRRELRLPSYQYYCSADDLMARARATDPHTPEATHAWAMDNAYLVAEACRVTIPKAPPVQFPSVPQGQTAPQLLWTWVNEGFERRWRSGAIRPDLHQAYAARMHREFEVLCQKGFADYMLAICDVVRHMKEKGALVMLRGSAAGCLLLWLAGACEVDPILHDLSFERFYDDSRPDPPDVDIDFEKAFRPTAIDYIFDKYGHDRCSQIAGLSRLGVKGALQDLCFALGVPEAQFRPFSDLIGDDEKVEVAMGRLRPLIERHPGVALLPDLVGQYRQTTVHAAGVLISSEPLYKAIGVLSSDDGRPVAAVDKRGAAALGLLKIDVLSVLALDVVGQAARAINRVAGAVDPDDISWVYGIPLNDPNVYAMARRGLTGVFQLDGPAAKRVAEDIRVEGFNDLLAAIVLCRPGPTDFVSTYRRHKDRPEELEAYLSRLHPVAADIVRPTKGGLLYQEQVMNMARYLAGLEWPYVHKLRKGVVDKLGLDPVKGDAWRAEWHELFVGGCVGHGVRRDEAEAWWESVQTHGGYSFNKSHGVSYGVVGVWMLWLKTYWPAQFFTAYLSVEDDTVKKRRLAHDFVSMGGTVLPLNMASPSATFSPVSGSCLAGGLIDLHGVAGKTAEKVLERGVKGADAVLEALPKATASRIQASRYYEVGHGCDSTDVDPISLMKAVPWFPTPITAGVDRDAAMSIGAASVSMLPPGEKSGGDVTVAGYVVGLEVRKDKVGMYLEDERGMVYCKVPRAKAHAMASRFQGLKEFDYAAATGWWTGEVLILKDAVTLRRTP